MSDVAILELKLEMRELRRDIDALLRIHQASCEHRATEQQVRCCSTCGTKAIEILPCTCRVQR